MPVNTCHVSEIFSKNHHEFILYLGMAEVETFLQLVSWSGGSSESLALQCDLIYVDVLGQMFPQWGGGHLSQPFLLQHLKIV